MTDDQIEQWKVERDIARHVDDHKSRCAALERVYDHRDEMMMECIAHQSVRQKEMMREIVEIKRDHPALVAHLREEEGEKLRMQGARRMLHLLGGLGLFGGGSAATLLLPKLLELLK